MNTLEKLKAACKAAEQNAMLASATVLDHEDEEGNPTGKLLLSVEWFNDHAKSRTEKGREQLQAETTCFNAIFRLAEAVGTVEDNAEGGGTNGPCRDWIITPTA